MKRVLVTGCAGFIGSHLCRRLLKEGHVVFGIDDLSCGFFDNMKDFVDHENFEYFESDVRFFSESVIEVDIIYHLAARGELYWCRNNPCEAVDINVNGTIHMLNYAKEMNCKHFVFADSSAEYDSVPISPHQADNILFSTYPTPEYASPGYFPPMGIYAISKMAASQYARSFCKNMNIPATLLRYFNVYGPSINIYRDIPPVIGSFASKMLRNEQCKIYGDGTKRRDFIYIDDVTNLHTKIINRVGDFNLNSTFNVGTGINYSINEIYNLVALAVWNNIDAVPGPDYAHEQDGEAQITLADISHTRRIFEWVPKFEIEKGIQLTVDSMR
jgi:nucleoside-diphosphate-sugar epimerase